MPRLSAAGLRFRYRPAGAYVPIERAERDDRMGRKRRTAQERLRAAEQDLAKARADLREEVSTWEAHLKYSIGGTFIMMARGNAEYAQRLMRTLDKHMTRSGDRENFKLPQKRLGHPERTEEVATYWLPWTRYEG